MIITKLFEVRDANTFIAAMAIRMESLPFLDHDTEGEKYLLRRCAWKPGDMLFGSANSGAMKYNPNEWGDRCMQVAHDFIEQNWDLLKSGDVIDVEFILGETQEPKVSERIPVARAAELPAQQEEVPF